MGAQWVVRKKPNGTKDSHSKYKSVSVSCETPKRLCRANRFGKTDDISRRCTCLCIEPGKQPCRDKFVIRNISCYFQRCIFNVPLLPTAPADMRTDVGKVIPVTFCLTVISISLKWSSNGIFTVTFTSVSSCGITSISGARVLLFSMKPMMKLVPLWSGSVFKRKQARSYSCTLCPRKCGAQRTRHCMLLDVRAASCFQWFPCCGWVSRHAKHNSSRIWPSDVGFQEKKNNSDKSVGVGSCRMAQASAEQPHLMWILVSFFCLEIVNIVNTLWLFMPLCYIS